MQNSFSTLIYPRGFDSDKNGLSPLYLRITVNGKRSECSIKQKVNLEKWNSSSGKLRGTTHETKQLNSKLCKIESKVIRIYEKLNEDGAKISSDLIKSIYLGKSTKIKMLLIIFEEHNDKVENLIGKDFAPGTAERYKTAKSMLRIIFY
ncbi:Arm DNA-binding domain-containing protein [Formosa haliotis]|uniref:Arm DNA-binding domain-containing protein n=1 Tax=Formosa haliotis TaxID=1555194 RepID=UPI00350E4BC1